MKCLYYLAPTLDSTHTISDDLHNVGVQDWYIHVISKDEAGLRKERIHSSNYIETLDFMRAGLIGAYWGFFIGLIGAALMMAVQPFGPDLSSLAYIAVIMFATCFGAWEGGLYGVATENRKLEIFHDDIETGKYLFLIYSRKNRIDIVRAMMREKHPESRHVATDERFLSPFSAVTRRKHHAS